MYSVKMIKFYRKIKEDLRYCFFIVGRLNVKVLIFLKINVLEIILKLIQKKESKRGSKNLVEE